jgi:hypothetical protein
MADANGKAGKDDGTVLVAWVTVHLESGDSFELLPFEDAHDVKSKVSELMKDWAGSGFLIRGSEIYPWHRVQRIVATKIEELSRTDSKKRLEEWQAKDTARLQQSFWKTKQPPEKKCEGDGENAGKPAGQRTAA